MKIEEAAELFVQWLENRVITSARGDNLDSLEVAPGRRLWLGRLAPEEAVLNRGRGDRGERLDPCAVGIRLKPATLGPWTFQVYIEACAWIRNPAKDWQKSPKVYLLVEAEVPLAPFGTFALGIPEIKQALTTATGTEGLSAEIRIEVNLDLTGHPELTILLVNKSPEKHDELVDTNLYETYLEVRGLKTETFVLESLPDSFRYDRDIPGYGINCGVSVIDHSVFGTTDAVKADKGRPTYWNLEETPPNLKFETLAQDPLTSLRELIAHLNRWGNSTWGEKSIIDRAQREHWTEGMIAEAKAAALDFFAERERILAGLRCLETNDLALKSFRLMNKSIRHSARGRYDGWRPFQIGFLLANIQSIVSPHNDSDVVDIVWFATGGGKTETYLGLLVTAAFFDRLTGKSSGITAWSRFPLRMLSLQQTQRFADAMAGAEIVRNQEAIQGDPFSVGFLVGEGATPNQIPLEPKDNQPDPDDDSMPAKYQVLLRCPFCQQESITMRFDRTYWLLQHCCQNTECPWTNEGLPFYIVDDEIFRFLPTIVVGTLDKAASIAFQAAMRGLVGPPLGRCTQPGHGYTYSPRKSRPSGCLAPGCSQPVVELGLDPSRFGPSFRLQDELHLLKDSLGAVDAHYETLYDHLELKLCGRKPKILASSATLTGYEKQVDVLYKRSARVFPSPGPSEREGFWAAESEQLARRFIALAPRGETLEFAVDRLVTELQQAIRELAAEPVRICQEAGVDPSHADTLLSLYGVNVVYGNTLRDLDAAVRSLETQIPVEGALNTTSLTGKTEFEEVRRTLERLDKPEAKFEERLHIIAASSMMSHGVDVDRLNVMVVLGMPLTTAEFIQATARAGRRWPGIVFVLHKMARERDASVYRSFEKFVRQGDRFVEAIPVTRRSRRVLARTAPGIELARILALHEPASGGALTLVKQLRRYFAEQNVTYESELAALTEALILNEPLDELLHNDLEQWLRRFFRNLEDPAGNFTFPSDLCKPSKPMRSLRDVEEQVPIFGVVGQ